MGELVRGDKNDSYRALFMASPERVLIVDADNGVVLDGNNRVLDFFDVDAGALIGKSLSEFADEVQLKELFSNIGGTSEQAEVAFKTASGFVKTKVEASKFTFNGESAYQLIIRDQQKQQQKQGKKLTEINTSRVRRMLVFYSGFVMSAALKDLLNDQDVDSAFYVYPDQLEQGLEQLSDVDFMVFAVPQITDLEVAEIKTICRAHRELPVLVMCLSAGNRNIITLVKEGVRGIITTEGEFHLLTAAINAISNNELWCPRSLLLQVFENFRGLPGHGKKSGSGILTEREMEILQLIVGGYKNKEIAEKLNISYSTVINHTYNIYRKLDVNNRAGAIRYALDNHLI